MPSSRDLIEALTSALPARLDDLLVVQVGGVDVPVNTDRITVHATPPHEDADGALAPGDVFVRLTLG